MNAEGAVLVVFALGLAGALVLYYLVRREGESRETMDRETAERRARRDTRNRE